MEYRDTYIVLFELISTSFSSSMIGVGQQIIIGTDQSDSRNTPGKRSRGEGLQTFLRCLYRIFNFEFQNHVSKFIKVL